MRDYFAAQAKTEYFKGQGGRAVKTIAGITTDKTTKDFDGKDLGELKLIPMVFAGWMRYLMAIDDNGEAFELSPDPLLDTVCPIVAGIKLGDTDVEETIKPLLTNKAIFGVDLYEVGLAELTVQYFTELIAGPGAIRETLKKYV
jgi:fructuronate reductase